MDPVQFEAEQIVMLPPHELVTYAKDQPQYRPLPVARLDGAESRVVSRWALTDEERQRLIAGEDLYLEQLTFGKPLQPVLLSVGLRDICAMDDSAVQQAVEVSKSELDHLKEMVNEDRLKRAEDQLKKDFDGGYNPPMKA